MILVEIKGQWRQWAPSLIWICETFF